MRGIRRAKNSWTSIESSGELLHPPAAEIPKQPLASRQTIIFIDNNVDDDDYAEESEITPLLSPFQWRSGRPRHYSTQTESHSKNYGSNQTMMNTPHGTESRSSSHYGYYEAKPNICDCRLCSIFFILIIGFVIATYLLIVETRVPSLGFTLDLVNHDIWSKMAIPLGSFLNHSNVLNVLILHTGGPICSTTSGCLQRLSDMQNQHGVELSYNFLIGDDGQTYEVRGWDNASGFSGSVPQNNSIVIGLIGNYTDKAPSAVTLQSALSLIRESVRRKKLQREYHIYGLRNLTSSRDDAEALFHVINKWPRYEALMTVL